jgi:hypothetical protein
MNRYIWWLGDLGCFPELHSCLCRFLKSRDRISPIFPRTPEPRLPAGCSQLLYATPMPHARSPGKPDKPHISPSSTVEITGKSPEKTGFSGAEDSDPD